MVNQDNMMHKSKSAKKRQTNKMLVLFMLTGITTVILITATYAWFIGIGAVSVNTFTVGIKTGENIEISLDGNTWSNTIQIDPANIANAYTNSTNSWSNVNGLTPVSSSGDVSANGRLKLFSKTSLTATQGGFRLLADQIDNYSANAAENDRYIAFDIFIRNGQGITYTAAYNANDDEAIYLTTDSSATVSQAGEGADYGVANSIRVAFVQIGRVPSMVNLTTPTAAGPIQAIECGENVTNNTPLCANTNTVIWEPNDSLHDSHLVAYYNDVCKGKSISENNVVYSGNCTTVNTTNSTVRTYTVRTNVTSANRVDIYDGLNNYTESIYNATHTTGELNDTATFTDTMKVMTGAERPPFFYLAPNSVTKIRVYIYLEGQDIDNLDLITTGRTIDIDFGFTKSQLDLSTYTNTTP